MRDSETRFIFLRAQDSETPVWDAEISRPAENLPRPIIFQGPFYTPKNCYHNAEKKAKF